jgi:hypothetical protein
MVVNAAIVFQKKGDSCFGRLRQRLFHCKAGAGAIDSPDRLYGILKNEGIFMMIGKVIDLKNVGKVDR